MVREVLKYSRTWVIIPSGATVQAWTQAALGALPSATTVEPKAATRSGWNLKAAAVSSSAPVSMRIMCWCSGGPWNHHSMSGASSCCTRSTSRAFRASYSVSTAHLLRSSTLSPLPLASS
ncbi:unnamed protein product [Musa acuminata subsp. burmannicoides]